MNGAMKYQEPGDRGAVEDQEALGISFRTRRIPGLTFAIAIFLLVFGNAAPGQSAAILETVLSGRQAAAVVLDVRTGRTVAAYGAIDKVRVTPGSTLKPFVLKTALDAGAASPNESVNCTGTLVVRSHNLACVHPRQITVLDARQALANSCNAYFAMVARRMETALLLRGLRAYGLKPECSCPTPEDRELLALGVEGISVSPRELAIAYRTLSLALERSGATNGVLKDGLIASVETGMAHAAFVQGMAIAGKTGTAHDTTIQGEHGQGEHGHGEHGWFAGIVFKDGSPKRVIVIYLPGANGNDAAGLAKRIVTAGPTIR